MEEVEDGVELCFRFPDSSKVKRRFRHDDQIRVCVIIVLPCTVD